MKTVIDRVRTLVCCIAVTLLAGCGPSEQTVNDDVSHLLKTLADEGARVSILQIYSGEGDSENVYKVLQFDIAAEQDVEITDGLFLGLHMKAGETRCGGKIELLYQKEPSGEWTLRWSEITKWAVDPC